MYQLSVTVTKYLRYSTHKEKICMLAYCSRGLHCLLALFFESGVKKHMTGTGGKTGLRWTGSNTRQEWAGLLLSASKELAKMA